MNSPSVDLVLRRLAAGGACLLALACLPAGAAEREPSQASIDAARDLGGLVACFPFAEGRGQETRNLLDDAPFSAMAIACNAPFSARREDYPRWVEGRWPGKPALGIGTAVGSVGRSHFYGVDGHDFSVSLWMRPHPVAADASRILLASVGDAWSHGWRLEATARRVDFILGRPQGEGPGKGIVVAGIDRALTPQVWHHLVGVLDGSHLRLAIDGQFAADLAFDGIYRHPDTPSVRFQTPELDHGGLQLGSTRSHRSQARFDLDELAVFGRALDASQVARLHAAGDPGTPADEQVRRHSAALEREAVAEGIAIAMPSDGFGYFPSDRPVPLTVTVSATSARGCAWPLSAVCAITPFQGRPLAEETLSMASAAPGETRLERSFALPRCGLYDLSVTVRDRDGRILKSAAIPFAVRVPLPARQDIPASAMLAGYYCLRTETPSLGTRMERIIQPIWGRAKDGGPDYTYSDDFVEQCGRMGIEVLYCLSLPAPIAGKYPTVADMTANPTLFEEHVRALALRYRGRVRYWEMLNEPNSGHFYGMTAAIYTDLLRRAHTVLKEVDPANQVVGPCGTSSYQEWTEEVLAAGGGRHLDILSFHNYLGHSPIENALGIGRVQTVIASMRRHIGRQLPLWNSECGIHQPARIDGRPATDEDLLRLYGGRASRTANGVKVGVDAIMMVDEHRSACWQAQSILVEMAEGVERYFLLMRPSQPYPAFAGVGEQPMEKGVALAALQSVIIGAKGARFLPTGLLGAAAVAVDRADGSTAVALFADRRTAQAFRWGEAAGVPVRGLDHLGNPLSFATGEGGLLRLDLDLEPLYLLGAPASFRAADGVRIADARPVLEARSEATVAAVVTNPFARPLRATLEAQVSCGIATPASPSFTLAPGESRTVPVRWSTGDLWRGAHWLRLALAADGVLVAAVQAGGFPSDGLVTGMPARGWAGEPDGDPARWAGIPAQAAATPQQAVIGRPVEGAINPAFWRGPADLSYTLQTVWSPDGLRFLVVVRDDVLRRPENPDEVRKSYLFDSLELFIDCRAREARAASYGPGAVQFLVVPELGERPAPCAVAAMGRNPPPVTVVCTGRRTAGGYAVEGVIRPVPGGPFQLAAGSRLNLDVAVDDNDDAPGREGPVFGRRVQMALHGTASNSSNTSAWGRYELLAPGAAGATR